MVMRSRPGDIAWIVFAVPTGLVLPRDGHELPLDLLEVLGRVWAPTIATAYDRAGRQWPGIRFAIRSRASCAVEDPRYDAITYTRSEEMQPRTNVHQITTYAQVTRGEVFREKAGGPSLLTLHMEPFSRGETHCLVVTDRATAAEDLAASLRTLADQLAPVVEEDGGGPDGEGDEGSTSADPAQGAVPPSESASTS